MGRKVYFFLIAWFLGIILTVPVVEASGNSGADYPVGKPNGAGYYNAQGFGEWNALFRGYHTGEDWNELCAGDCDLGKPVYSISDGMVVFSGFAPVWGNIIIIRHQLGNSSFESMYAHLDKTELSQGDSLVRGSEIGTIGKGDKGSFVAHLHFEVRDRVSLGNGPGYSSTPRPAGWVDPTNFINSHRPPVGAEVMLSEPQGGAEQISWSKSTDPQFDHVEVCRSTTSGGTNDPAARTLVFQTSDPNVTSYSDANLAPGSYFYKITTFFKNGLSADSGEKSIEVKREVKDITVESTRSQSSPTIAGGKVYFEDLAPNGSFPNHKIVRYDIASAKTEKIDLPSSINYAYQPVGTKTKVAFYATDWNNCSKVYYYDLETQTTVPVTLGDVGCQSQVLPDISDEGIVVWQQLGPDRRYDIYYNDTRNSKGPVKITDSKFESRNPRISGTKVIWKDNRNTNGSMNYELYVKDISTGDESLLAQNTSDDRADVWGNWAIWQAGAKIYLINLKTKEQKTLVNSGGGYSPSINEGKVAYTLAENGKINVRVYDIVAGTDTKIDYELHMVSFPSFGEGYVAFDDLVGTVAGNKDIILAKL